MLAKRQSKGTCKALIFIPLPSFIYLENKSGETDWSEEGPMTSPGPLVTLLNKMEPLPSLSLCTTPLPHREALIMSKQVYS